MKARDAAIENGGLQLFPPSIDSGHGEFGRRIQSLHTHGVTAHKELNGLFPNLDAFSSLHAGIREKASVVLKIAGDFHLNAINAPIASDPLGQQGATLGTIASFLNRHSHLLSTDVTSLSRHISGVTAALDRITSNISAARLILEMALLLQSEIICHEADDAQRREMLHSIASLEQAFSTTLAQAITALASLQSLLPTLHSSNDALQKDIISLQVAQICGLTEAARITNGETVRSMFVDFRGQLNKADHELNELSDVVHRLVTVAGNTPARMALITEAIAEMQATIASPAA